MPSFQQWADFSVPTLEMFGPIELPPTEEGWKNWGSSVVSLNGLTARGAPSPYEFSNWRDWAARLIEVVDDGS
jgi:hypothetical protein